MHIYLNCVPSKRWHNLHNGIVTNHIYCNCHNHYFVKTVYCLILARAKGRRRWKFSLSEWFCIIKVINFIESVCAKWLQSSEWFCNNEVIDSIESVCANWCHLSEWFCNVLKSSTLLRALVQIDSIQVNGFARLTSSILLKSFVQIDSI